MRRRCWASPLGDCAGALTGEHLISVACWQHEDPLATREQKESRLITFRFRDRATGTVSDQTVTLRNLRSKILCAHHNASSSELDAAGGKLCDALGSVLDLTRSRPHSRIPWKPTVHRVDEPLVERWFMKTAINLARRYKQALPIGGPNADVDYPTPELVEMVYGRRSITYPYGLWFLKPKGTRIDGGTNTTNKFWLDDEQVCGAALTIGGFAFAVNLCEREPDFDHLRAMHGWKTIEPVRPFAGFGQDAARVERRVRWPASRMVER
jgi:hypothetical protein